jgi:integrase
MSGPWRREAESFLGFVEEVSKFWNSFGTFRDLALVGLMLLDGLRSCEVLALRQEDLRLAEAQLWVLGTDPNMLIVRCCYHTSRYPSQ